ncbi:hypothetical protein ACE103_09100 [Bradyrhizobium sp. ma5]|uniref:hypothetical protein n=1 Tax=Bradyrhizobium sp. ma5 TaxID=3344828 RepID=UPI0035D47D91
MRSAHWIASSTSEPVRRSNELQRLYMRYSKGLATISTLQEGLPPDLQEITPMTAVGLNEMRVCTNLTRSVGQLHRKSFEKCSATLPKPAQRNVFDCLLGASGRMSLAAVLLGTNGSGDA